MKTVRNPRKTAFEQGPIRPPSEAGSLLIRFTRNCPWNRCAFCPVYKGREFSRRTEVEIRNDIDAVRVLIDHLRELSHRMGYGGRMDGPVVHAVSASSEYGSCARQVAFWLYAGKGTVFIQDANSLILPTRTLVELFRTLKETIPGVTRITSYARSSTLARKGLDELREIRAAGLDRIHIGMESGSDRVLQMVGKGATAREHTDAGIKTVQAGITLSEYVMPGLGGTALSEEHAVETAKVLNAVDPHFIRLRSLRVMHGTPLHEQMLRGEFTPLSDDDTVREIRLFIEHLHGIRSTLASDHIMNLLEEVEGTLPKDKDKMLAVIDRYLAMPEEDRLLFRLGRRGGALRSLDEFNDPGMRQRLECAMKEMASETGGDLERVITELGNQPL